MVFFASRLRPGLRVLAAGIVGLVLGFSLFGPAQAASLRAQVDQAIEKVRPALVRIHVIWTDYRDGRELKMQTVGSGAIITEDGYLVTNHHVAGHGARMVCTLSTREEVDAELVGTDPLTDIAVLKLKPAKPRKFPTARFGDSAKMRVGDSVLAMGSPMALSQSITLGILSNIEMVMPRFAGPQLELDGENVGGLVRWFAHDAAIYGGNSGGPLVNLQGQIIGINEISFGLSGAIPGNLAHSVAKDLMSRGKVIRSWLGFNAQPLFKSWEKQRGVLLGGVVADSPAGRAGLQSGDLLLSIGGKPVHVRFDEEMPEFMGLISNLPIGEETPVRVLRDGKEMTFKIVPVERPEALPRQRELKEWGITARDISFLAALNLKRTNQNGILVTSIRAGGPAGESKPTLFPGDVLVEVDGRPVNTVQDLIDLTRQLTATSTEPLPLVATFEREARRYLTVVKIGTQDMRDPGLEVAKAWLPVETQVISRDVARALKKPDLQGFYITEVYPGTTAEKAGLRPGDFVLAVDKEKLTASNPEHEEELAALIRQYDIGATVELKLLRGQTELKVPVELMRSPKLRREMKKYRNDDFEFVARDISFFDIAEERWPQGQKGALIEDVKSGSWAEVGSLGAADLVVEVDGKAVENVDSLKKIMTAVAAEKRPFVVIKVIRGIHSAYLELEPSWKK